MNQLGNIEELRTLVAKWQPWGEDDNRGADQPLRNGTPDRTLLVTAALTLCLFLAALINAGLG
jgi:hypothetical protein